MISPRKYQIVQRILLLSALFVLLYYGLVFGPLYDRVQGLDRPLQEAWLKLLRTHLTEADPDYVDIDSMDQMLSRLQASRNRLDSFGAGVIGRTLVDPAVLEKMKQPFQLVEFQNERQLLLEELDQAARAKQISLAPSIYFSYPEYSADLAQPGLLWAHLAVVHQALITAIRCDISTIESVNSRPPAPIRLEDGAVPVADELSVSLQLTGSSAAVSQFLACLPLRAQEAAKLGLPEIPKAKPDLFIDRVVIRKETPEKPDVVRLDLRFTGLVYREGT